MKPLFYFLFLFLISSCTITSMDRENITTYDPSVDIKHIEFEGGDGRSAEEAIVILKANTQKEGVASEYAFLKRIYGEPNGDWKLLQFRTKEINQQKFDVLKIKNLATDSVHTFYFNVSGISGSM